MEEAALEGGHELFAKRQKAQGKGREARQGRRTVQQIGKLQMELEWLKKSHSCSDCREWRSWWISRTNEGNPRFTVSASSWGCPDPRCTTSPSPGLNHPGDHGRIVALYLRVQNLWKPSDVQYLPEKRSRSAVTVSETSCAAGFTGHYQKPCDTGASDPSERFSPAWWTFQGRSRK